MPAGDEKQRIRERAYELWEREGRPQGRDLEHWVQAERETLSGSAGLDRAGEGNPFGEPGRRQSGEVPSRGPERGFGAAGGLGGTDNLSGKESRGNPQATGERPGGTLGGPGQPARATQAGQGAAEKPARARGKAPEQPAETAVKRGGRQKE
jgi:DUF2934 family protein